MSDNDSAGDEAVRKIAKPAADVSVREAQALLQPLAGKQFVVTGDFPQSRDVIGDVLRSRGATIVSALSKKCTHLLAGMNVAPTKRKQAKKFKLVIWGPNELAELLDSEQSITTPDVDLGAEPNISCFEIVLSYLSGHELGLLNANAKWPSLGKDSLWNEVVDNTLAQHSFFSGARKMLKKSLETSPAIIERTYKDFFLLRLYPLLQDLAVYERMCQEQGASCEKLGEDLTICAYLTPNSGGANDPLHFAAARVDHVGGNAVFLDPNVRNQYAQDLKENALFIGQISCLTYKGLLATEGLLPLEGSLLLLLKGGDMDSNGGTILHVDASDTAGATRLPSKELTFPQFAVKGVFERLESKGGIPWEVSAQFKAEYEKRYPGRKSEHKVKGNRLEVWMGGRSTSQQGNNEVGASDFLVLQANFDGDTFMDGIETYFILRREKLEQCPPDLSYSEGCNFSLYANC